MLKRVSSVLLTVFLVGAAYLLFWPVPIDPVAWTAPENEGYVGAFAANQELRGLKRISLKGHSGPEDVAIGPAGRVYLATHGGSILRYDPVAGDVAEFAKTGGRPLGIEFSREGKLYVADAFRGLLEVSMDGGVTVLADKTDTGSPIRYANDVDIAADGTVYFTDASTKFGASEFGGTLPASLLDLMEHGPNGRVLRFDPTNGKTTIVLDGLSFANGVALTADGRHLLVVETGTYSIIKVLLGSGAKPVTIVENLPGFPDNISRTGDGTFWFGLVSPRSDPVDGLSDKPFLRKVVQRLPKFIRPGPKRYGFVLRIDETGKVLETLQDPSGDYALTTGLVEDSSGRRYISSLVEPDLGLLEAK